jgi:hypothetical protein
MRYYHTCWSIEGFFKECKQNLKINNCQTIDFDEQITWIKLISISSMILSLRKKFDVLYETKCEVFRDFKNELIEIMLVEQFWQIIEILFFE